MDLKGISWVGNIYHKFEAMCLEVEEVMYQDTVKYVENQVQTVGSSVKKFYSDVMLDLLPPSPLDAAKGAVSDVPLELYAGVGVYMKPKAGAKETHGMVYDTERGTEDLKIAIDKSSDDPPPSHRLCHLENIYPPSQGDSAGRSFGQQGKRGLPKKLMAVRKNSSRENTSLAKKSGAVSHLDKELTSAASFCEPSNDNLGDSAAGVAKPYADGCPSQDIGLESNDRSEKNSMSPIQKSAVTVPFCEDLIRESSACEPSNENHKEKAKVVAPGLVDVTRHDPAAECTYEIENSTEQIPDFPMDEAFPNGTSKQMDDELSLHETSSAEANAAGNCIHDGMDFPEESCATAANGKVQSSEIVEDDFVTDSVARSDDCSTGVKKVDFLIDQEMEIIQQAGKTKLEESGILVDADEYHFVPHNGQKGKSYKKTIRKVFSPRKKLTRKHEYEQLFLYPGSDSKFNQQESAKTSMLSHGNRTSTPDSGEAEWELL